MGIHLTLAQNWESAFVLSYKQHEKKSKCFKVYLEKAHLLKLFVFNKTGYLVNRLLYFFSNLNTCLQNKYKTIKKGNLSPLVITPKLHS